MCAIWIALDRSENTGPVLYSIRSPGREIDLFLSTNMGWGGGLRSHENCREDQAYC